MIMTDYKKITDALNDLLDRIQFHARERGEVVSYLQARTILARALASRPAGDAVLDYMDDQSTKGDYSYVTR